jgi:hypothetical protein
MTYSPLQEGNRSLGPGPLEAAPGDHIHDGGTSKGPIEYTPVWSSTGTAVSLGDGTIYGKYVLLGKMVHVYIELTMGASTTYGTGAYRFSLPRTSEAGRLWVVRGLAWDGGTLYEEVVGIIDGAIDTMPLRTLTTAGSSLSTVQATVPFTFGAGDKLMVQGTYGY